MVKLNHILLLFFVISLAVMNSCEKNVASPTDELEATGILGNWEIYARAFGTLHDLSRPCCEFIEFTADEQPADQTGMFNTSSPGFQGDGTFVLSPSDSTILLTFSENGRQLSRTFRTSENGDFLYFNYEENGVPVGETWSRAD